jgi:hypothetical protein
MILIFLNRVGGMVTLIARFQVDGFEPRPGTGTGGFRGWSGSTRILHDDQGAYFEIDLPKGGA